MGKYFLNQETQKIELHFDKPEYMALSDEQKAEIKRFFLWSRSANAWVSRGTKDHYWAEKVAEKLGLENEGKQGERLSYAEQIERKVERAENRAERMETHAENAEHRAEALQKPLNDMHGDIAFFTQPNINSSAGRAFTNYRNKLYARYDKGFEEYRKSAYFADRAATARRTANMAQLKDPVYLHNRIKECNSNINAFQKNIVQLENTLYKIQQGEEIKNYRGEIITEEHTEENINYWLEKMEAELDKLAFMENCMDEIGGVKFSRENIKEGYIVNMRRWGKCEVTSTGPVNVGYKILEGGAAGLGGVEPYEAITEILNATKSEKIINPFEVGDILASYSISGNNLIRAYQVVKVTETGVKIQQIAVIDAQPIPGKFISSKAMQKKVVKSKYSNFIGVYLDNWQLSKYQPKQTA